MMKPADYLKTLIPVGIVLSLTLQKGNGSLLIFLLLFFLLTSAYSVVRMIRRPAERRVRGTRLAVWFAAFVLASGTQGYWSVASKNSAELALKGVLSYKERAGRYPASLAEVGMDDNSLKDRWKIRYTLKDGVPSLIYPAPFMPLEMHEFDFQTGKWRENAF